MNAPGRVNGMIDRRGPVPAYQQVADVIAARIEAGELEVDGPIPSEETMRQEYGVSRGTVRRAVEELRERGLGYTVPQRWQEQGASPTTASPTWPCRRHLGSQVR